MGRLRKLARPGEDLAQSHAAYLQRGAIKSSSIVARIRAATDSFRPVTLAITSPAGVITSTSLSGRADGLRAVGNHQVAEFFFELGECRGGDGLLFQREAHDPAAAFFCSERGNDVVGLDQVQIDRLAGFVDLVRLDADRSVVAGGSGADQAVAVSNSTAAAASISSVETTGTTRAAAGYSTSTGPLTTTTSCPSAIAASASARAHAAAGSVREIPHRVEVLARGAGGDEDAGHRSVTC